MQATCTGFRFYLYYYSLQRGCHWEINQFTHLFIAIHSGLRRTRGPRNWMCFTRIMPYIRPIMSKKYQISVNMAIQGWKSVEWRMLIRCLDTPTYLELIFGLDDAFNFSQWHAICNWVRSLYVMHFLDVCVYWPECCTKFLIWISIELFSSVILCRETCELILFLNSSPNSSFRPNSMNSMLWNEFP